MTKNISSNPTYQVPNDWRGKVISNIRILIKEADSEVIEDVKYKTASNPNGVLVWYHDGMLLTGEVYQKHLRLSLAKGQLLKDQDPKGLINSYRAIILHEEDNIDETAFKNLIQAAVKLNRKNKSKLSKAGTSI